MIDTSRARRRIQWAGLAAGPLLAAIGYALLPDQYPGAAGEALTLGHAGRATLAVMLWMAVWWLTEAIDISATALLPIALLPVAGAATIGEATAPYADKLIFLFLGGFLLALAMQRWGLDRRIALITLRLVGTRPANMVAGIMLATAVLSMFVSNTATAAMMLPIALSVVVLVERRGSDDSGSIGGNFALCMMLGIAYAASIGGIGTKIGTPPNGILLAFVERNYGIAIDFLGWLKVGLPLVIVFLPLTWFLLTRVLYPVERRPIEGAQQLVAEQHAALGPVKRGEWATFIVFMLTALCWIFRPLLARVIEGLDDSGIAIIGGLLLFVIPVERRERTFAMNWETARRLPWGILILFGGGLSLAAAVKANVHRPHDHDPRRRRRRAVDRPGPCGDGGRDLPDRADLEHRDHGDAGPDSGGPGAGLGRPPLRAHLPRGDRRELRLHDAGGHAPQRDRLRLRLPDHPPDVPGRHLAEPDRGGAGHHPGVCRDHAVDGTVRHRTLLS
ncbi:MAG: SLC13 family permease [Planctomycetota bacterium]|jgi:sodium-dependent dicarboxylate transporter 2/3/5